MLCSPASWNLVHKNSYIVLAIEITDLQKHTGLGELKAQIQLKFHLPL